MSARSLGAGLLLCTLAACNNVVSFDVSTSDAGPPDAGATEGEGEGDPSGEGEGEGDPPGEGEGEGDPPGEGEGEGDPPGEGEGENPAEGEGEGDFVTASGGQFWLHGQPFRFVGANVRGLPHYGHGNPLPYAGADHVALNLDQVASMGGRVIRVFAAADGLSNDDVANRLRATLDAAQQRGIYVIAALTDFYASTPFHPSGDGGSYSSDNNGFTVLNHAWFAGGYRDHYLPMVRTVVTALANHPALFAWELGNEIKDATFPDSSAATFISFCHAMADEIRVIDTNHMIAVGEISVPNAGLNASQGQQLFSHPALSFLTIRSYHGSGDDDTGLANTVGRPIIVEEAGYSSGDGDRPNLLRGDLDRWFGRGVDGYLQWGFMASGNDNGDGDTEFGMDAVFHADWNGMFSAYRDRANTL